MINEKEETETLQNLLKRVRELQEIVTASQPILSQSQEVPVGYTSARWQLALQSFNERLASLKERNPAFLRQPSSTHAHTQTPNDDENFEVEFGPEWDLKCAQNELNELLNK